MRRALRLAGECALAAGLLIGVVALRNALLPPFPEEVWVLTEAGQMTRAEWEGLFYDAPPPDGYFDVEPYQVYERPHLESVVPSLIWLHRFRSHGLRIDVVRHPSWSAVLFLRRPGALFRGEPSAEFELAGEQDGAWTDANRRDDESIGDAFLLYRRLD